MLSWMAQIFSFEYTSKPNIIYYVLLYYLILKVLVSSGDTDVEYSSYHL